MVELVGLRSSMQVQSSILFIVVGGYELNFMILTILKSPKGPVKIEGDLHQEKLYCSKMALYVLFKCVGVCVCVCGGE